MNVLRMETRTQEQEVRLGELYGWGLPAGRWESADRCESQDSGSGLLPLTSLDMLLPHWMGL